jgi:hypothetical protein
MQMSDPADDLFGGGGGGGGGWGPVNRGGNSESWEAFLDTRYGESHPWTVPDVATPFDRRIAPERIAPEKSTTPSASAVSQTGGSSLRLLEDRLRLDDSLSCERILPWLSMEMPLTSAEAPSSFGDHEPFGEPGTLAIGISGNITFGKGLLGQIMVVVDRSGNVGLMFTGGIRVGADIGGGVGGVVSVSSAPSIMALEGPGLSLTIDAGPWSVGAGASFGEWSLPLPFSAATGSYARFGPAMNWGVATEATHTVVIPLFRVNIPKLAPKTYLPANLR